MPDKFILRLKIFENKVHYDEVEVNEEEILTIGRSELNNLVLNNKNVSKEHCKIYSISGSWWIEDLGSANGTIINGSKIIKKEISIGDLIQISNFTIEVFFDQSSVADDNQKTEMFDTDKTQMFREDSTVTMLRSGTSSNQNTIEIIDGQEKGKKHSFAGMILVGRDAGCDLSLSDRGISRKHFSIKQLENGYEISNLNNQNITYLNEKIIQRETIRNNDIVKAGDTTFRLILPGSSDVSAVKIDLSKKNPRKKVFLFIALLFVVFTAVLFFLIYPVPEDRENSKGESIQTVKNGVHTKLTEAKDIADNAKNSGSVIEKEIKKEKLIEDAEKARKITRYIEEGKEFLSNREFSKALFRFNLALDIDPENTDLKEFITLTNNKQREEIDKEQKEKVLTDKISNMLRMSRKLSKGEYLKAREVLLEIKKLSPSNKEASDLLQEVNKNIEKEENRHLAAENERKILSKNAKEFYDKGQNYYNKGEYYAALKEFEKSISLGGDNALSEDAKKMSSKLRDILIEKVMPDVQRALTYYNQKAYSDSLALFKRIEGIYPEYPQVKEKVLEIQSFLEEDARKLYQEGLVYEGIDKMDQAISKWKAVIKLIPVESNEYYQKAKNKLDKYSR